MAERTTAHQKAISTHEKFIFRYFQKISKRQNGAADAYHLLNQDEIEQIRQIRRKALLLAALYGALGVVLLYTPTYFYPEWFEGLPVEVPFWGEVRIPVGFTIYGTVLATIEIALLMMLNLHTVHRIAYTCGFPNAKDPAYQRHILTLFEVSLEKPDRAILDFYINPMEGLSRFRIFVITTLGILKATLSNLIVKTVLARVLGRFAIRAYVDLIGIPIFAFWNMYATHRVIREAKVRIMAPNLIKKLCDRLFARLHADEDFKTSLYDILQFIAVIKRNFHQNHFLLADRLLQVFDIQPRKQKPLTAEEIIRQASHLQFEARQGLAQLLIFGMMIDGKLSAREIKVIESLQARKLIQLEPRYLKEWENSFLAGKGMPDFFETQLVKN